MTGVMPVARQSRDVLGHHYRGPAEEAVRVGRHPAHPQRDQPVQPALVRLHDLQHRVRPADWGRPVAEAGPGHGVPKLPAHPVPVLARAGRRAQGGERRAVGLREHHVPGRRHTVHRPPRWRLTCPFWDMRGAAAGQPGPGWSSCWQLRRGPVLRASMHVMRVVVLGAGFGGLELTDPAVRGARRRRRRRADRQVRRVRLRLLEARRHVRPHDRRCGAPPVRATSSSPACGSCRPTIAVDRPGRQAGGRDRRRHLRGRRAGRRARRRPRPGGDARPGRGRQRVLHRGRRVRAPRRARRLRRRPGDRRRHLDAVQVPAGAERDRAADARLPRRARAARAVARCRW